jgi:hypothetical protein
LSLDEKAIEQAAVVIDRAQVNLEIETVFTGNPVALADLWNLARQLGNPGQLSGGWLDPDDRRQVVTQRPGIDLGSITGDDAGRLKASG